MTDKQEIIINGVDVSGCSCRCLRVKCDAMVLLNEYNELNDKYPL